MAAECDKLKATQEGQVMHVLLLIVLLAAMPVAPLLVLTLCLCFSLCSSRTWPAS